MRAIRHLVATAVNGLNPQRISIVDEQGQLLADGATDSQTGSDVSADERQAAYEKRLRQQVETIVSSVVGPGHSRVQVNADFDFNRITQTSDKFDPDGRVIRSSQTREETNSNRAKTISRSLSATNCPAPIQSRRADAGAARPEPEVGRNRQLRDFASITKTEVIEGGRVNRLSVAVLVDGTYGKDDKGDITYQPRSKEELDQIATLVRSAIGFDQKRGDQVDVVNLRFADTPTLNIPEPTGWLETMHFTKDDIMRAIEMVVMGMLGLVVLLVRGAAAGAAHRDAGRAEALHNGMEAHSRNGRRARRRGRCRPGKAGEPSMAAKMIDIAQIQGQVHAQSVKKVGELADKNPEETVAIIRHWLHEMPAA